jgi:hypothetical protein
MALFYTNERGEMIKASYKEATGRDRYSSEKTVTREGYRTSDTSENSIEGFAVKSAKSCALGATVGLMTGGIMGIGPGCFTGVLSEAFLASIKSTRAD